MNHYEITFSVPIQARDMEEAHVEAQAIVDDLSETWDLQATVTDVQQTGVREEA